MTQRHRRQWRVVVAALFALSLFGVYVPPLQAAGETVSVWLTTDNLSARLAPQPALAFSASSGGANGTITVDPATRYQTIDGFGASFTDAAAKRIFTSPSRNAVMRSLFHPSDGIGVSMVRQPFGATDFTYYVANEPFYTYDDTCCDLSDFSIAPDMQRTIPLLQQARGLNPGVRFIATPWTAPRWMKNPAVWGDGSRLRPEYYQLHAEYIARAVKAYEQAGIPIYAITPQNEPGYGPFYPSMLMSAQEQATFIGSHLGPVFAQQGIGAKILAYDHNYDTIGFAQTVLRDPTASQYVAGTAWHGYGGSPGDVNPIRDEFPTKEIYGTEASPGCGGPPAMHTLLETTLNWHRTAILWNIALDYNPAGDGSGRCFALVELDDNGTPYYRKEYYHMGHFSKFVHPGATRIGGYAGAASGSDITAAAFENSDGTIVVNAWNRSGSQRTLKVAWQGQSFTYSLGGWAAATFRWKPGSSSTPAPGTQLFFDDFEDGDMSGWTSGSGSWAVCQPPPHSRELCASSSTENIALAGDAAWRDYSVQAYAVGGGSAANGGVVLLARASDSSHFYQFELKYGSQWAIWKNNGGTWSEIASGPFTWSANTYYLLRFEARGSQLTGSYSTDHGGSWTPLGGGSDSSYTAGRAGVRTWGMTGRFDQVRVIAR